MSLAPIADAYTRLDDLSDVTGPLDGDSAFFAGGTDMIPLQRSGVTEVRTLVDIKSTDLDADVSQDGDAWTIGALATLGDLEDHDGLAEAVPAIREAMRQVATRQIRNRATVGGNLLQRPRCSYFRAADIDCWMKGGDSCPARDGVNEFLGVVPNESPCVAVQPSDLASVLVMLGATVSIRTADGGDRRVAVADLLADPTDDRRALNTLASGELVRSISIPATSDSRRSTYRKAMDRAVWQFALVGLAASVTVDDGGTVTAASLVASGVGAVPHVLDTVADSLVGSLLDDDAVEAAARSAVDGLVPLDDNAYKLRLLQGLVRSTLRDLAA